MPSEKQIKGDAYEDLSKQILLLKNISWNEDGVQFDKEEPNSRILGVSGAKHQIDIHLTSSKLPEYHLICECKHYDGPIEKTLACSFVTVVRDIGTQHPGWKIIGAFLSNKGFNSGATKVLSYYEIAPLFLEDVSNKEFKITISESSTRAIITVKKVYLKDGTEAKPTDIFENRDRADLYRIKDTVGFFELLDEAGKIIEDPVFHKGKFKTGKRKYISSEDDKFERLSDKKELASIEGSFDGNVKTDYGSHTTVFKSPVKCILRESKDIVYHFNKDGSVNKIDYSGVDDE